MNSGKGQFMMLNTDMEIMYDIDVDNFKNGTQCVIETDPSINQQIVCSSHRDKRHACPKSSTANLVAIYAKVNCSSLKILIFKYLLFMI